MPVPVQRFNSILPLCLIAIVLALLVPTVLKAESPVAPASMAVVESLQPIATPGSPLGISIPSPSQATTFILPLDTNMTAKECRAVSTCCQCAFFDGTRCLDWQPC